MTVVVAAAVKLTAVPTSAAAHAAPVYGITAVVLDRMLNLALVAVPATVQVSVIVSFAVPVITSCQTLMLCPADEATRLAEEPVPATAIDKGAKL